MNSWNMYALGKKDQNTGFDGKNGKIIFRYDNAPHHDISTFPHHKHLLEGSKEKGFIDVLKEIEALALKI